MDHIIQQSIRASIVTKQSILDNQNLLQRIQSAADTLIEALRNGHRVLWCGNGGSAADAQHLAAELSGRF